MDKQVERGAVDNDTWQSVYIKIPLEYNSTFAYIADEMENCTAEFIVKSGVVQKALLLIKNKQARCKSEVYADTTGNL